MSRPARYQDVMSPLNHGPVSSMSEGPGMVLDEKTLKRCGNLFRASIWQRQALTIYWVKSRAHFTTRRRYHNIEPARRLPPDAIEIGTYQYPVHEQQFLEDLKYCVAPLPQPEQIPAPRAPRVEAKPKAPEPVASIAPQSFPMGASASEPATPSTADIEALSESVHSPDTGEPEQHGGALGEGHVPFSGGPARTSLPSRHCQLIPLL